MTYIPPVTSKYDNLANTNSSYSNVKFNIIKDDIDTLSYETFQTSVLVSQYLSADVAFDKETDFYDHGLTIILKSGQTQKPVTEFYWAYNAEARLFGYFLLNNYKFTCENWSIRNIATGTSKGTYEMLRKINSTTYSSYISAYYSEDISNGTLNLKNISNDYEIQNIVGYCEYISTTEDYKSFSSGNVRRIKVDKFITSKKINFGTYVYINNIGTTYPNGVFSSNGALLLSSNASNHDTDYDGNDKITSDLVNSCTANSVILKNITIESNKTVKWVEITQGIFVQSPPKLIFSTLTVNAGTTLNLLNNSATCSNPQINGVVEFYYTSEDYVIDEDKQTIRLKKNFIDSDMTRVYIYIEDEKYAQYMLSFKSDQVTTGEAYIYYGDSVTHQDWIPLYGVYTLEDNAYSDGTFKYRKECFRQSITDGDGVISRFYGDSSSVELSGASTFTDEEITQYYEKRNGVWTAVSINDSVTFKELYIRDSQNNGATVEFGSLGVIVNDSIVVDPNSKIKCKSLVVK